MCCVWFSCKTNSILLLNSAGFFWAKSLWFALVSELRAEVDVIEQMSSSGSSSSSDSGSGDDSSCSDAEQETHLSPSRNNMANGMNKSQGSNQLMSTLRKSIHNNFIHCYSHRQVFLISEKKQKRN